MSEIHGGGRRGWCGPPPPGRPRTPRCRRGRSGRGVRAAAGGRSLRGGSGRRSRGGRRRHCRARRAGPGDAPPRRCSPPRPRFPCQGPWWWRDGPGRPAGPGGSCACGVPPIDRRPPGLRPDRPGARHGHAARITRSRCEVVESRASVSTGRCRCPGRGGSAELMWMASRHPRWTRPTLVSTGCFRGSRGARRHCPIGQVPLPSAGGEGTGRGAVAPSHRGRSSGPVLGAGPRGCRDAAGSGGASSGSGADPRVDACGGSRPAGSRGRAPPPWTTGRPPGSRTRPPRRPRRRRCAAGLRPRLLHPPQTSAGPAGDSLGRPPT